MRLLLPCIGMLLLNIASAIAQNLPAPITIDPAHPSDYWLAAGTKSHLPPTPTAGLRDLPAGNIGWFDYIFFNPNEGWRKLAVEGHPHVGRVELEIDAPQSSDPNAQATHGSLLPDQWVWITAGSHRLRIMVNHWTGLPQITSIHLDATSSGAFQILPDRDHPVTTLGKCMPLHILAGGNNNSAEIAVTYTKNEQNIGEENLSVPVTAKPEIFTLPVPCDQTGDIMATVKMEKNGLTANETYSIYDTHPVIPVFQQQNLVTSIDAVAQAPDFSSGVTEIIGNLYRQSGDIGTTAFVRGRSLTDPSWFAYRIEGLIPNHPYLFEITYPDDADRVFVAAYRDSKSDTYPISLGAETGGVWTTSHSMAKRSAVIWPTSNDGRVIIYNLHDGKKAALARVNFYALDEAATPSPALSQGRDVTFWSEEGSDFKAVVGKSPNQNQDFTAIDRYLRLIRASGGTAVAPNVNAYNFQLYPSRYNLTFAERHTDTLAGFMLGAAHYGLKVYPELNPRADELIWSPRNAQDFVKRLLISGTGETHYDNPDQSVMRPPYYNALNPDVRKWYRDMIGDLADRYKNYPAFAGIQLRETAWQNPALNNLVSLDWGYNAAIISDFFKDTNLPLPTAISLTDDSEQAVRRRHDALTHGTLRDLWIQWRCTQITNVMRDIVARVRQARPDLVVQLTFFALSSENQPDAQALREQGLDIAMLQKIDGLELVDERFQHGAKEESAAWQKNMREGSLKPDGTALFATGNARPATLHPMQYMEITDKVAPSTQLGWAKAPHEPWVSADSEPTGRLRLARFAELVGMYDVYSIGDGGNGYVFAGTNDGLTEFLTEFHALPKKPFERVPQSSNTIIVRQKDDLFYVVSMSPDTQNVHLPLNGVTNVQRVTNGKMIALQNNILTLDLQPYQLIVFKTDTPAHIKAAE